MGFSLVLVSGLLIEVAYSFFFLILNIEVAYSCGEPTLACTGFSSYGTWAQ